jgi:hypothetical protein
VVVARPAVIVGSESTNARRPASSGSAHPAQPGGGHPAQPGAASRAPAGRWQPPVEAAPPPPDKSAPDNIFGGDLISEKSLDEVILAYLSEDLNEK